MHRPSQRSPATAAAAALRQTGIRTQLYTGQRKFKQRMSYADKLGVPFVLILGEDEIAQGKVTLKDMATGQQQTLSLEEAAQQVRRQLDAQASQPPILDR